MIMYTFKRFIINSSCAYFIYVWQTTPPPFHWSVILCEVSFLGLLMKRQKCWSNTIFNLGENNSLLLIGQCSSI